MIHLEKITWDNWKTCLALEVTEVQKDYVASTLYGLAQSYVALLNNTLPPMTYVICKDKLIIGFVMIVHNTAQSSDYSEESYEICRILIDKKYQNKGYGKKAFSLAMDHIKTLPQGPASCVYLTYHPDNKVAKNLYASFGFVENKDLFEGEIVARLPL